jgi:DNA (cytosine-5)-methyltransferase 1
MRFGSVCSGIEAASVAWHPLGWQAAWLSEIEPFPSAVLAHHYPSVPNLGDMTTLPDRILSGEVEAPDLFCGGTPCQAFSVAGLRQSLDDARGNLSLTFCEIANAIDHVRSTGGRAPAIVFWENVPGVLSTKDNAFGCFLAGLAGEDDPIIPPGDKWQNAGCVFGPTRTVAWRVLDAQYFGVAQRRRRVFVVASARAGFDPAQVLFEFDGVRRDTAPSREAGKVAPTIPSRSTAGGGLGTDFDCDGGVVQVCPTLRAGGNRTGGDRPPGTDVDTADSLIPVAYGGNNQSGPIDVATARNACASASGRMDFETETFLVQPTHTLRGEGFDASEDGTGRGTPLVPVAMINMQGSKGNAVAQADGPSFTLNAMHGHDMHAVAVPVAGAICRDSFVGGMGGKPEGAAAGHLVPVGFTRCDYGNDAVMDGTPTMRCGSNYSAHLAVAFHPTQDLISSSDVCHSIGANDNATAALPVAFTTEQTPKFNADQALTLTKQSPTGGGQPQAVMQAMQVRRLTPVECERLQGFPDNYTAIPWRKKPADQCPDGPRYKALGNSWAVPVVRWIGERIARHA